MIRKLKLFKHLTQHLVVFIDNPYFEDMVGRIYPTELQLGKTIASDTEAPFFWFTFIIFKRIGVPYKINDKRDDFIRAPPDEVGGVL